jgi:hypothetical protein
MLFFKIGKFIMKPYFVFSLFVTLLLLPLSHTTKAQWAALNAINLDVQGSAIRAQVRNQVRGNQEGGVINSTKPKNAPEQIASTKLAYKPSAINRRANLKRFVEKTRANSPRGAVQMEQLFASNDVIGQINQGMGKVGLKPNNVADAYALYWVSAWLGSRGRVENSPKSQMIAVRNQAAGALLKVPEFTSATDAQKQELTEAMLIQAALIEASIEGAKSDPALLAQTQKAIAKGAEGFGLDLYSMTLTPQGFRPAK